MHLICANLTVIAGGAFFVRKNSRNRVIGENARRSGGFGLGFIAGILADRVLACPMGQAVVGHGSSPVF
jgi:hypothetical protein